MNTATNQTDTVDSASAEAIRKAALEAESDKRTKQRHENELKNSRAGRVFGYSLSFAMVATSVAALATAYVSVTKK